MVDQRKRQATRLANPVRISHLEFRIARKLLNWSRAKLARQAGVPLRAVAIFELYGVALDASSENRLRRVLEFAGIDFAGCHAGPARYAYRDGRPGVSVTFSGPLRRRAPQ